MKPRILLAVVAVLNCISSFSQEAIGFTSIQRLTNSEVRLRVNSSSAYRIDATTNLPFWRPLVSSESRNTQHLDSGAPFRSARYYALSPLTGGNFITGDHIATTNGEVVVKPIDHASFVMRWQDKMIYNDPVGASSLYAGFPKADLILVSHTHGDHFNATTINSVRATNGIIVAPLAVFNQLSPQLRTATIVLTNGATTNVSGLHIEAVPAYNGNHPRGVGNGYVVTIGGTRFYIAGDTGSTPEMRALQNIDVAFLCMNVPFTMDVPTAANAAKAFRPRILYPYHYRNQDQTFANFTTLKNLIGVESGIEVRLREWY